jgi:hypothetical protein
LTLGGFEHQRGGGNNVSGRRGWHGRKIKLKEFEHEEGHIALRVK